METKVESAFDVGGDVLEITGTVDGKKVTAKGWVSATTNYYTPDCYDGDGVRNPDAQPRMMVLEEKIAYCTALLEAAASVAVPVEPQNVLFQGGA